MAAGEATIKTAIMTRLQYMKKLATSEARKLKKFATKEEINRLNLKTLNPEYQFECIYGQMTGNCFCDRSHDLIRECATKLYEIQKERMETAVINGSPKKTNLQNRRAHYYSPIEALIFGMNGGRKAQKKIIAFLKDETKTLEL